MPATSPWKLTCRVVAVLLCVIGLPVAASPQVQLRPDQIPGKQDILPIPLRLPVIGQSYAFQSENYPTRYIRHRNFLGELTAIETALDIKDSTFRVVLGLASESCVSLESVNYPDHFLRHQNFELKLHKRPEGGGEQLFREDACFKVVAGLADAEGLSFESHNYPGRFIRHRNFRLYLEPAEDSDLARADATFHALHFEPYEDFAIAMEPATVRLRVDVPVNGSYELTLGRGSRRTIYTLGGAFRARYSLRSTRSENYRFTVCVMYDGTCLASKVVEFVGPSAVELDQQILPATGTVYRPFSVEAADILHEPIGNDIRPVYFGASLKVSRQCPVGQKCCEVRPDGSCAECIHKDAVCLRP